ncbi:MAG: AMP-binding protein [Psittacicella sp.]
MEFLKSTSKSKSSFAISFLKGNLEINLTRKEFLYIIAKVKTFILETALLEDLVIVDRFSFEGVVLYLASLSSSKKTWIINSFYKEERLTSIYEEYNLKQIFNLTKDSVLHSKLEQSYLNILNLALSELKCVDLNMAPDYLELNLDTQILLFSSGSTGKPKCIVHNIGTNIESAIRSSSFLSIDQRSKLYLSLPIFHVSGQAILFRWLYSNASLFVGEKIEFSIIDKITHTSLVQAQLVNYLEYLDLQKIIFKAPKIFLLGGSYIDENLCIKASNYNIKCFVGYGLTETASAVAIKDMLKPGGAKLLDNNFIKIDKNGVIFIKSKSLFLGYLSSSRVINTSSIVNGYFNTKDIGVLKEEELFVTGRLDNMFISGGENIFPEEIESLIYKTGFVSNIFIIPKDNNKFLQVPVAFIDSKSYQNLNRFRSDLEDFLSKSLEKFKIPKEYFELKEEYLDGAIKYSRNKLINLVNS